jgi:hypothetical protein
VYAVIRDAKRLASSEALVRCGWRVAVLLCVLLAGWLARPAAGQTPTKEYIRLGGRVIAIENCCAIGGRITVGGAPLAGVTITAAGTPTRSATTNSNGDYLITGLTPGSNYTATPSLAGYAFTPASSSFSPLASNQLATNFTAASTVTYSISGQVTLGGGGLSGITVNLSGSSTGSAQTNSSGNFTFTGLPAGGNYTVTPSSSIYTFQPTSLAYNNLSANQTGANFSATRITYTISGRVTLNGNGLGGVAINVTGTQTCSVSTDSSGNYSCPGLPAGGNYVVTPSKAGYGFIPVSRSYSNLAGNQTAADFSATAITYTISGRVTLDGNGLGGVTITVSGTQGCSVSTDSNGYYSCPGLPAGGSYTVTPSKLSYSFSPSSLVFSNLSADQTAANFTASLVTYGLSGRVTRASGTGIASVYMPAGVAGGVVVASGYTDSGGNYSLTGIQATSYLRLAPSLTNNTFTPTLREYQPFGGTLTGQNFTGNAYPTAVSVSPSSGSARRQTMQFVFRDLDGASDLDWVEMVIATSQGATGCVAYFSPASYPTVYLGDSTGSPNWRTASLGSGSAIQNMLGNCKLYPATSSRTLNGTDLTLSLDLEYAAASSGTKGIWVSEKDLGHSSSVNWVQMGNWYVPAAIGGRVVIGATGAGLSGVIMNLSGCASSSITTDTGGYYSFSSVPAGGSCTVAPSAIARVSFSPASRTFNPTNGNLDASFTATLSVSATLTDTTRPSGYRVGDSFRVDVAGPPNRPITVIQTFNGVPGSETQMGTTNSSGTWSTSGTWTGSNQGTYSQVWKVAGVAAPSINFTISPSVVMVVPGRSGTAYRVGDSFTLTVSGTPNRTVTVSQNGAPDYTMGSTGGGGTWSTSGTFTSGNIGSYTQVWKVNGTAALPTLTFTVSP